MRVLTLRHLAFEDLGAWGPALAARGFQNTYLDVGVRPFRDLDPSAADLLIVLGGPIGVYETEEYPFLVPEIEFIAQRLDARLPTIGVCLGAQLMAAALGARVYPGNGELGFAPIALTQAGRASPLAPFAEEPLTLHWHGDTFDLPEGATLLASTTLTENQAFAVGDHALAVQFHPEWGADGLEPWLVGHTMELRKKGVDIRALREEADRVRPALAAKAERVLGAYLAGAGLV